MYIVKFKGYPEPEWIKETVKSYSESNDDDSPRGLLKILLIEHHPLLKAGQISLTLVSITQDLDSKDNSFYLCWKGNGSNYINLFKSDHLNFLFQKFPHASLWLSKNFDQLPVYHRLFWKENQTFGSGN
ncbi:hypothetical protein ACTFIR_003876 [Dictyostelium discoideum]